MRTCFIETGLLASTGISVRTVKTPSTFSPFTGSCGMLVTGSLVVV